MRHSLFVVVLSKDAVGTAVPGCPNRVDVGIDPTGEFGGMQSTK